MAGRLRIVQEALTNVARHAGVREVTVQLWSEGRRLFVQIQDRGRGFDLAEAMASRGDAKRLHDMFGLSINASLRYTDVVDHPGFDSA